VQNSCAKQAAARLRPAFKKERGLCVNWGIVRTGGALTLSNGRFAAIGTILSMQADADEITLSYDGLGCENHVACGFPKGRPLWSQVGELKICLNLGRTFVPLLPIISP
jgi:hypothetical protein